MEGVCDLCSGFCYQISEPSKSAKKSVGEKISLFGDG